MSYFENEVDAKKWVEMKRDFPYHFKWNKTLTERIEEFERRGKL